MAATGIRELKNNLSRYLRRVIQGERILVTDRGRVVAELRPPPYAGAIRDMAGRYQMLIDQGVVQPAREEGDPLAGWPRLKLPSGSAADLVDDDRGEE
jgi:antitoxin (DNA-binding transcriptional repressor) of toxin-antitoxin stability system